MPSVPDEVEALVKQYNAGASIREVERRAGESPGWLARNTDVPRTPSPERLNYIASAVHVPVEELDYVLRKAIGYRVCGPRPLRPAQERLQSHCDHLNDLAVDTLTGFAENMRLRTEYQR